jgi:hypothetical protein
MEGKVEGFFKSMVLVLACIAFYNIIVKSILPSPIVTAIGI